MNRDDLKKLLIAEGQTELTESQIAVIDKIMAMNGKDVEKAKGDLDKTKADLEAVQADVTAKQKQIEEANAAIEGFKGMDIDGIKKTADEWKAKAEQAQKDAAAQLLQVRFNHALERELGVAKAKDPKEVQVHLNMDGLKYDEKDDKVIGLPEQLEKIKTERVHLFVPDEPVTPPPTATAGATAPVPTAANSFMQSAFKAAGLQAPK